jgi:hypothetical protein
MEQSDPAAKASTAPEARHVRGHGHPRRRHAARAALAALRHRRLPERRAAHAYQPGGATILLDAQGEVFADLAPVAHEVVSLDTLPDHVPAAFLAVEDKRFYQHNGIDFRRVGGALVADIKARRFVEGFSTITMQLARNVWPDRLPGQQRTITRKVLEVRVAHDIERRYTKDEILELYLNHIYFGGGAYGIEAASRNYFGKPAARLTLEEAAVLAALPKSPTLFNPRRFADRARERSDLVLSLMAQQGIISDDEAERATSRGLRVQRDAPRRRSETQTWPYFVEATRRVLEDRFGEASTPRPCACTPPWTCRAQRIAEQQLEQQLRAIERGAFGRYTGPATAPPTRPTARPSTYRAPSCSWMPPPATSAPSSAAGTSASPASTAQHRRGASPAARSSRSSSPPHSPTATLPASSSPTPCSASNSPAARSGSPATSVAATTATSACAMPSSAPERAHHPTRRRRRAQPGHAHRPPRRHPVRPARRAIPRHRDRRRHRPRTHRSLHCIRSPRNRRPRSPRHPRRGHERAPRLARPAPTPAGRRQRRRLPRHQHARGRRRPAAPPPPYAAAATAARPQARPAPPTTAPTPGTSAIRRRMSPRCGSGSIGRRGYRRTRREAGWRRRCGCG